MVWGKRCYGNSDVVSVDKEEAGKQRTQQITKEALQGLIGEKRTKGKNGTNMIDHLLSPAGDTA
ncbi:unnamed protein product [Prunus armeniaca]|uniref:Uncharacterized protein n=1 Tax=Prunus armeniaca TaxID=36596 RepID=A0A6J5V7I5_PRUAR|nr:unnamed protein product [Prunus armeniaca]